MDNPDSTALDVMRLLNSDQFGKVVRALERGFHICSDDADYYLFVESNFEALSYYFRVAFESQLIDRGWFHLAGHPDYYGKRKLSSDDVITGSMLAHILMSPDRLASGGVPLNSFIQEIKSVLGGDDPFLSVYRPGKRRRNVSPATRMEKAEEDCRKSIGRLVSLGFARWVPGTAGKLIDPREPCARFTEIVKTATGTTDENFAEAIRILTASGRLAAADDPSSDETEGDDEV